MLLLQLVFEAAFLMHRARLQNQLRRLRHVRGDFVELDSVSPKEFSHLPGLQPSPCFHLFLSREPLL